MLEAINGGRMSAIDVFSKALKYLSSVLVEFATTKAKFAVTKNDICWVLTVPAIWKPGARHFMRNAAHKVCRVPYYIQGTKMHDTMSL